jgi:signal peptidase II
MPALPLDVRMPTHMALPTENFKSPAALSRFALTTVLGVGLDLITKSYAFHKLALSIVTSPTTGKVQVWSEVHPVIPGWIEIELTANQGAVFGLGQGMRAVFVGVSLGAILFLSYLFATSGRRRAYQIVLGMLLAGVLGNMYDRITLGYVRDMIHALPRWPHFFPWIFNVADMMLCVGVGLMIVGSLIPTQWKNAWSQSRANPQSI